MRGGGRAPPPSPARTDFTLITECTPENSGCNSVYSVQATTTSQLQSLKSSPLGGFPSSEETPPNPLPPPPPPVCDPARQSVTPLRPHCQQQCMMTVHDRRSLAALLLLVIAARLNAGTPPKVKRPHIILIVADDLVGRPFSKKELFIAGLFPL
jgi:hypothetical protein